MMPVKRTTYTAVWITIHLKMIGMVGTLSLIGYMVYLISYQVPVPAILGMLIVPLATLWGFMQCMYPFNYWWKNSAKRIDDTDILIKLWKETIEGIERIGDATTLYNQEAMRLLKYMINNEGDARMQLQVFESLQVLKYLVNKEIGVLWIPVLSRVGDSWDRESLWLLKHTDGSKSIGNPYTDQYLSKMEVVAYMPIPD